MGHPNNNENNSGIDITGQHKTDLKKPSMKLGAFSMARAKTSPVLSNDSLDGKKEKKKKTPHSSAPFHLHRHTSPQTFNLAPSQSPPASKPSTLSNFPVKPSNLFSSPATQSNKTNDSTATLQPATLTPATLHPVKKSGSKILKFGKKATKFVGDIAFGSAIPDSDIPLHPHIPQYNPHHQMIIHRNQNQKQQLSSEYNSKLKTLVNLTKDHSMVYYLEYLRFFLKYMDESEASDPLNYAITRNSLWNQWLTKYLNLVNDILKSRDEIYKYQHELKLKSEFEKQRLTIASDLEHEKGKESEISSLNSESLKSVNNITHGKKVPTRSKVDETSRPDADFLNDYNEAYLSNNGGGGSSAKLKQKRSGSNRHNSVTSLAASSAASTVSTNSKTSLSSMPSQAAILTSIDHIKTKIDCMPTIEQIDKEIFQDRRIILLLLWHNQIVNRLSNENLVISNLLKHHPKDSEVCVIITNRLKPFKSSPDEILPKLMKNHLSPAHLELIDGWQIRHDFPDYKTNLVTLTDRFQVILDLRKSGYLPDDLSQQFPHFSDFSFLSDDFINTNMSLKERSFLASYSSFAAPSLKKLPFKDNSQCLVYSPDFTRLVMTENDIKLGLDEFNRVLKPHGAVSLIMFDIFSFKNQSNFDHDVCLSEYILLFLNSEFSKFSKLPNITEVIIKNLKEKGFQNIKFVKLGIPAVNYYEKDKHSINGTELPIHSTLKYDGHGMSKPNTSNDLSDDNIHNKDKKVNFQPSPAFRSISGSNMKANLNEENASGMYSDKPSNLYSDNDTSPNIADNPIASVYAMFSSFIDFMRVSQMVDLHSWVSDPKECHMKDSEMNGIGGLSEEKTQLLKLWIDWKLNGFSGKLIRSKILSRLLQNIDRDGYDSELRVRLLTNDGEYWTRHPAIMGNINLATQFFDNNQGSFGDGTLSGLDYLFLVTGEKGKK